MDGTSNSKDRSLRQVRRRKERHSLRERGGGQNPLIWMANLRWSWENGSDWWSWFHVISISWYVCNIMWQIDTNSKYWWNLFDLDSTTNEGRSAGKKYQKNSQGPRGPHQGVRNLRNLRIWSHRPLDRWKFSKKSKGFCISKTARGMAVGLSPRRRKMWRLRQKSFKKMGRWAGRKSWITG